MNARKARELTYLSIDTNGVINDIFSAIMKKVVEPKDPHRVDNFSIDFSTVGLPEDEIEFITDTLEAFDYICLHNWQHNFLTIKWDQE